MTDGSRSRGPHQSVSPVGASDARRWIQNYEDFDSTRLERVQSSARVWLGVLTTLLGLLGSVVLFKGGDLVTSVTASQPFQVTLIVLVSLVFGVTVLAVIFGGQATWGGLQGPVHEATKPSSHDNRFARGWERFAKVLAEGVHKQDGSALYGPQQLPWEAYRRWSLRGAARRRLYLHASRTAGVIAAGLIAALAIMAVIAGTVSPAPAEVIVVHHGRLSCGPVGGSLRLTGVTQVITVNNC